MNHLIFELGTAIIQAYNKSNEQNESSSISLKAQCINNEDDNDLEICQETQHNTILISKHTSRRHSKPKGYRIKINDNESMDRTYCMGRYNDAGIGSATDAAI